MILTSNAFAQVTCSEDRFKGDTTCQTSTFDMDTKESDADRANLIMAYTGSQYVLYITTLSDEWQYLSTDTAYFLIDGDKASFKIHRVDTDVRSGNVIEQYAIVVSPLQIKDFMKAQQIEFKIDNDIYSYPEEGLKEIGQLTSKVSNLTKGQ